jgi:hypothetical protein
MEALNLQFEVIFLFFVPLLYFLSEIHPNCLKNTCITLKHVCMVQLVKYIKLDSI